MIQSGQALPKRATIRPEAENNHRRASQSRNSQHHLANARQVTIRRQRGRRLLRKIICNGVVGGTTITISNAPKILYLFRGNFFERKCTPKPISGDHQPAALFEKRSVRFSPRVPAEVQIPRKSLLCPVGGLVQGRELKKRSKISFARSAEAVKSLSAVWAVIARPEDNTGNPAIGKHGGITKKSTPMGRAGRRCGETAAPAEGVRPSPPGRTARAVDTFGRLRAQERRKRAMRLRFPPGSVRRSTPIMQRSGTMSFACRRSLPAHRPAAEERLAAAQLGGVIRFNRFDDARHRVNGAGPRARGGMRGFARVSTAATRCLCAGAAYRRVGSPTTARSGFSLPTATAREPAWPCSSSIKPVKTISVSRGRCFEAASSQSA